MSCTKPHLAWRILDPEDGKYRIHFLDGKGYDLARAEAKYGKGDVLLLPCGKCIECKKAYARDWANRCVLEASSYENNWFVTLTYDDEHIGSNKLDKRDMQLFLKKVRRRFGDGIRFFGCGEYGEKSGRKHLHIILFNLDLPDVNGISKGRHGGYYYDSPLLTSCWSKGNVLLGDCTFQSCQYVARYCLKKVYQNEKTDEFLLMSRRPGIGYNYLINNAAELMKDDVIYFYSDNGLKIHPPRYWDKLFQKMDPMLYEQVKSKRLSNQDLSVASEILRRGLSCKEDLFGVKEVLGSAVIKRGL